MQFKKMPLKGTRLSPQSRALVTHLQTNGRQTFDQLHALFREPSYHRSNGPNGHTPDPNWLRARLKYMRDAGHVSRLVDEGVLYYVAGYQPGDREAEAPAPAAEEACITPPRRIYVMTGGTYVPPRPTATRAGAMDFADCPSIDAGRARPFIPGKVIHG